MFQFFAKKVSLDVTQREIVTSGSVNVYQCQFQFDSAWDGLEKTAVFKAGDISISVLLDDLGACNIPWEVFQDAKRTLYAGVYGTKNDNVVLPTIWANCGEIKPGVTQGENTQPPTPDVYSQILQVAKDAEDVAQSVRDDADSGKFNGEQGPTGPQGYTYTPAVSEEGVISWTNDGSLPNPSPVNIKGPQGKQGIQGPRGYTYTPSVGEDGTVSWTNDGNLPNPDPVNITGPQGETGETPDITAGTVETLEPGQDATAEITGETPNLVLNLGIPKGQPGQDAPQIDDDVVSATNPWSSLKIVDTLAPPFSSSGAIVTCNPVAGYPLHVVSQIMPVQEGEGDPSPDNVRPIRGWTEVNLWVGGKNLWDAHMLTNGEFVTYENREMFKYIDGNKAFVWPVPKRLRNEQLTFASRFYRDDPWKPVTIGFNHISQPYNPIYLEQGVVYSYPTRPANGLLESISGSDNYNRPVYMDLTVTQLELGASATNYDPYRGRTITLPFGQTVYGGTLDWTTGVLTVTHAEIASYSGESLPGVWISDRDVYSQGATPTTGAQVVYSLADPITVQLTPQEILALSGTNTIYTDTGDTTVSGRADPNAIIQQFAARIAALEGQAINR